MNQRLIDALISDGYSQHSAEITCVELMTLRHEDLKEALALWLDTGKQTPIGTWPFDSRSLMQEQGMKYPSAIVFIDWVRQFPNEPI